MLCIFKTPLVPHPDMPGKLQAKAAAGACQEACHTQVAMCEHDPTVLHQKEGRYLLALETKRYFRGRPLSQEQETALAANPDLLLFSEIEEREEVAGQALDITPREVMISAACLKSNGKKMTIKDFPAGWNFGNGVTVGVTVPIKNSEPCVLSWVVFPDSNIPAVQASYDALRAIMED
ncbi:MAG: hypothetical protein IH872_09810 [Chloroflexi bacterium]|nr:hypothetical protein [Chloroflexota bacterium]